MCVRWKSWWGGAGPPIGVYALCVGMRGADLRAFMERKEESLSSPVSMVRTVVACLLGQTVPAGAREHAQTQPPARIDPRWHNRTRHVGCCAMDWGFPLLQEDFLRTLKRVSSSVGEQDLGRFQKWMDEFGSA